MDTDFRIASKYITEKESKEKVWEAMIKCVDIETGNELGSLPRMPGDSECKYESGLDTYQFKYGVGDIAFFKKRQETNEQIENSYTYHAPKEGQPQKYEAIRDKAKELAYLIDELCPSGRYKSLASTQLETVVMWANKSIACDE